MELYIKNADTSDVGALYTLNKAFNGDCTTEELIADSLLNNNHEIVLIAYVDEKPAGFLCGQICRSMCYKTLHGEIGELFVLEKYRRRGIAKMLIEHIETKFSNYNIYIVDIATSVKNHIAQSFYSSCGYEGKTKLVYRKNI